MVSYEHLRQVTDKLSMLLIRTDRGIYKKKPEKINMTQSIILQSMQKVRKSAIGGPFGLTTN